MRIRSIQAHLLSYPLPDPLKVTCLGGEQTILKRDTMLIRVEADNGLIGYGPAPGTEPAKNAIARVIAPFLTGRTLADPDALRVHFLEETGRDPGLQRLYCAVEIALYDLVGKEQGRPVSELLGGRVRDRIRLYASAGLQTTPEGHAEEARAISDLGFRAYKMQSGMGPPDQDLDAVRRLREAVGPDFDLIVDAHTWWQASDRNYLQATIDRLAEQLGEYNIAWLEEPLPPDDHEGYRRLKELDLVSLASGVHEPDEPSFLDLILAGVDYLQLDLVSQGGYATGIRMVREVSRAGLKFAFHSWGTALEVIAAAHLAVCWPDQVVEWLEYPCYSTPSRAGVYPFPLAAEVLKEPLQLDHGDLILPKGPGLGIEVDEGVIERYPWIPGPCALVLSDSKPPSSMSSRGATRQAS